MEIWQSLIPILLLSVLAWHSNIANSAIIVNQNGDIAPSLALFHQHQHSNEQNRNVSDTVQQFQEALTNYAELTNAYYSPAQDETIREKRTLGVIRRLANATRSGFSTLRSLFAGFGGSSGGSSSGGGFRSFFSNLLNRILVFMTNLWDRITGIFRGQGGSGGGSGGGLFSRLFSIFRPPTTTESYDFDSDFSYQSSPSTPENENEVIEAAVGGSSVTAGSVSASDSEAAKEKEKTNLDDSSAGNEATDDFIPFPGDSDVNSRTGKALERSNSAASSPVALAVQSDGKSISPHIVSSPSIIHLLDDGRRFA